MDALTKPVAQRESLYSTPDAGFTLDQNLISQWLSWKLIYVDGSNEDRETAWLRLMDCLLRRAVTLDLSGLNLTELPKDLPLFILALNVDKNQLTALPDDLPADLTLISAEQNWLTHLPKTLPDNLQELNVSINQLSALSGNLPKSLIRLYANNNQLTQLPDTLPDSLQVLSVSRNDLNELPARLPAGLCVLEVTENILSQPPATLPAGINSLNLARNMLIRGPSLWPPRLKTLNLSNNRLTVMPENLPDTLVDLNISNNPINELTLADPQRFTALRLLDISRTSLRPISSNIWQLPAQCNIVVESNFIVNRLMHGFDAFIASSGSRGPRFIINPLHYNHPTPHPTLAEAAAYWYPPARRTGVRRAWNVIARNNVDSSIELTKFLHYLAGSIHEKALPGFRSYMRARLDQWTHKPALLHQAMLVAHEATTTCEDRITLTLKEIEKGELVFNIEQGAYDKDLPALVTRGRVIYRQEKLQHIAVNRINAYPQSDAVEVYLAYLVKLNKRLALNSHINRIRFYYLSELRQKDIDSAEHEVKQEENSEFVPWLLRWSPWDGVMNRMDPTGYAQMLAWREETLENTYQQRLQSRLAELALRPDAPLADDAAVQLGKTVIDEIETECRLPLLRQLLGDRRQLALIEPFWRQ